MLEKRTSNTTLLMYFIINRYCEKHNMCMEDFEKLNEKYGILKHIAECPDVFYRLTTEEKLEEIEKYISQS